MSLSTYGYPAEISIFMATVTLHSKNSVTSIASTFGFVKFLTSAL